VGSWNFSSGILRAFVWSKDFFPTTMKMTKAQCWIQIHGLPMEYWQPKVIFCIARGVNISFFGRLYHEQDKKFFCKGSYGS